MKTQDAIDAAGSTSALALLLDCTLSAISQWGEYPPDKRQLQIEKFKKLGLKAEPGCLSRVLGFEKSKPADKAESV